MNCKPGDLAVIVRSLTGNDWAIGRVIRVTTLSGESGVWHLEVPLFGPRGRPYILIEDYCLKPLRDPGDDARDETLSWLPVPTTKDAEVSNG